MNDKETTPLSDEMNRFSVPAGLVPAMRAVMTSSLICFIVMISDGTESKQSFGIPSLFNFVANKNSLEFILWLVAAFFAVNSVFVWIRMSLDSQNILSSNSISSEKIDTSIKKLSEIIPTLGARIQKDVTEISSGVDQESTRLKEFLAEYTDALELINKKQENLSKYAISRADSTFSNHSANLNSLFEQFKNISEAISNEEPLEGRGDRFWGDIGSLGTSITQSQIDLKNVFDDQLSNLRQLTPISENIRQLKSDFEERIRSSEQKGLALARAAEKVSSASADMNSVGQSMKSSIRRAMSASKAEYCRIFVFHFFVPSIAFCYVTYLFFLPFYPFSLQAIKESNGFDYRLELFEGKEK